MSEPPSAAGRRRVGRGERERQILDAAIDVFTARGYAGASMAAVAARVGVTKPVLYSHFGSKDGLLLACVARARAELLDATTTAAATGGSPQERLRRGTRAFFDQLDAQTPTWTLLYAEAGRAGVAGHALEEVRARQTDFIAGLLAEHDPDVDPQRLVGWAQVIVGACERLAVWRGRAGPTERVTADRATDYLMDLVWAGLATRGSER